MSETGLTPGDEAISGLRLWAKMDRAEYGLNSRQELCDQWADAIAALEAENVALRAALVEVVNLSAGPFELSPVERSAISVDLLRHCYLTARTALAALDATREAGK